MNSKVTKDETFKPVKLEITITNQDELNYIASLFNMSIDNVKSSDAYPFDETNIENDYVVWSLLEKYVKKY